MVHLVWAVLTCGKHCPNGHSVKTDAHHFQGSCCDKEYDKGLGEELREV